MSPIDPRDFGALEANVAAMRAEITQMRAEMRELTALLQQVRGARWTLGVLIGVPAFFAGIFAALKGMR